jgi:hypothetical protein
MHYHITHWTLVILLTLWTLLWCSYVITGFVTFRRLKHGIKGLLDVFDPGTALLGDDFVFGLFHGRPAWVSLGSSGLSRAIHVGLKGRFFLPFEVQNFNLRRSARTHDTLVWAAIVVMFLFAGTAARTHITVLSLLGPTILALIPAIGPLLDLRRRHRSAPSIERIDMALAATRLTPFETRQPDRVRAALDKPEIREPLARIFDSCRADGVKAESGARLVSLEAFWRLPRRVLDISLLNIDNIRGMLTELSTLCAGAERILPETKAV